MGGMGWRTKPYGGIEVEGRGVVTSGGQPMTARLMLVEYGPAIKAAAARFGVPVPWLVGMCAIESIKLREGPRGPGGSLKWGDERVVSALRKARPGVGLATLRASGLSEGAAQRQNRYRQDPVSIRYEAAYVSPEDTPGRVSAGLMQTLLSTARAVVEMYPDVAPRGLDGAPRVPHLGDLLDPALSLLWGAGYLEHQRGQYSGIIKGLTDDGAPARGLDFVLATGSYNAGGIYHDDGENPNPFRLVTYSPTRTMRGIQFHNDCYKPEVLPLWAP